jgi:hypothetical protein
VLSVALSTLSLVLLSGTTGSYLAARALFAFCQNNVTGTDKGGSVLSPLPQQRKEAMRWAPRERRGEQGKKGTGKTR